MPIPGDHPVLHVLGCDTNACQTNSWFTSIATFVAKLLFAIGHYILNRKVEGEKKGLADRIGGASLGLVEAVF